MGHEHGRDSQDCRDIFARLSEYLDEELDPELCEKLEGHMGDCPPCQAFLESLRNTVKLVGQVDRPELPEEIRLAVRRAHDELKGRS